MKMRPVPAPTNRKLAIVTMSLALQLCPACHEDDPADPSDAVVRDDTEQALRHALAEAGRDGFSGGVFVSVAEQPVLAEGHGMADRDAMIPNTERTAFDFGSFMKDVTAAGIFKLIDDKRLTPSSTLAELLPGVPSDKQAITVVQLLQHRAGFGEYHDVTGDFEMMTRLEARARILEQSLLFAPGTQRAYSNSGYTLLADVIEAVSDRTFQQFVRDELLTPSGANSIGFYNDAVWSMTPTAIGYGGRRVGDNDPATWSYTWALVGNGGLVSTPTALTEWFAALEGCALFSCDTVERWRQTLADTSGGPAVLAGGNDYGHAGVMAIRPSESVSVTIGTNAADAYDYESLAERLVAIVAADR